VPSTCRLVVTTWEPDDVDALLTIHADPETMRFVRHGAGRRPTPKSRPWSMG